MNWLLVSKLSSVRESETVKNQTVQNNVSYTVYHIQGAVIRYRALRIFRESSGYMVQLNLRCQIH